MIPAQRGVKHFYCVRNAQHESLIDLFLFPVLLITGDELLASHIKAWNAIWSDLQIDLDGDDELVKMFLSQRPTLRF